MIAVIAPKISVMTTAVRLARSVMRRRAVAKVVSTASPKRAASRSSWPNAWTIFIAPSTSVVVAPTLATRSWLERATFSSRRPMNTIGSTTSGMPSSSMPVSLGASEKR